MALLKLIASEGSIVFDDHLLEKQNKKNLRSLRKKMQIVFQDPFSSLSPRMTVEKIVAEGLDIHEKLLSNDEKNNKN